MGRIGPPHVSLTPGSLERRSCAKRWEESTVGTLISLQVRTITCFIELPAATSTGEPALRDAWGPSIREAAEALSTIRGIVEDKTGLGKNQIARIAE